MSDESVQEEFDTAFAEFSEAPREETVGTVPEVTPPADVEATTVASTGQGAAEAAPTPAVPAVDHWATAPAELVAERERLKHEALSNAGRVAALQRQIRDLQSKEKEVPAPVVEQEDPEWQRVQEEYPDVVGPLSKRMDAIQGKATQAALKEIEARRLAEHTDAYELQQNAQVLDSLVPDWKQVAASPEFTAWQSNLPRELANAAASSRDPHTVAMILNLFNTTRAGSSTLDLKREMQREAAQAPAGGVKVTNTPGPPDDFDAAFKYYADRNK